MNHIKGLPLVTVKKSILNFARLSLALAIFIGLSIVTAQAMLYDQIYTVSDVKVDVQASTAVEAQKQAIKQAHVKAFEMLIERMVPEEERGTLADVTPEEIERYVDGYEVNSQKQSNVRYIATMTFYFQERAIRNFLGNRTVRAVESSKPPMVIVPVMIDNGAINLWGDENPWLRAWTSRDKFSVLVPIEVPLGDLRDISTVDGMQVVSGQVSPLNDLARRYGAAGVIVATLKRDSRDPMAPMAVEISMLELDGDMVQINDQPIMTSTGAPVQQFDQAINLVVKKVESFVKDGIIAPGVSTEQQLLVRIPFSSPQMWMSIQKTLRFSGAVRDVNLKSLSRNEATVGLVFKGTTASLGSALGAQGLQLEQLNGSTWIIRPIGAGTSTPSS